MDNIQKKSIKLATEYVQKKQQERYNKDLSLCMFVAVVFLLIMLVV